MSKVIIICTSPRRGGNSDTLAAAFARGAQEAGHEVETVSLAGQEVQFCRGCMVCTQTLRCVIHDYADQVREKMLSADVVVWATPVYYYSVSGQMKTMIDRANPLYNSDYRIRSVYLLATAAEADGSAVEGAQTALMGWVECLPKTHLEATIFAGGVTDKGDISDHPALTRAYEAGKSIG